MQQTLETYGYAQLKELEGHEVVAVDGETIGYIDLVFRDVDTGVPEWLGIWDGLPHTKSRFLVPVRGVEIDDDVVRIPWPKDIVHEAPSYDPPGGLIVGDDKVVEIDPQTERRAYEHYGIEPETVRDERLDAVQFRVWRIQSF